MQGLLQGKKGLVLGALDERSIAWQFAVKAHEEGATMVFSNTAVSIRIGKLKQLAEQTSSLLVAADVSVQADVDALVDACLGHFGGGFDFILHAVAMSNNTRKGKAYHDLDYEQYHKTLDISAISLHRILSAAWKKDALNEWASVVALSYLGAARFVDGYGDMAEAKATLESVVRSFGAIYGKRKKVRINTVSQSPTYTPATSVVKGFDRLFDYTAERSPLGNASAQDCASFIAMLCSDHTRMLTMQNLFHDGGFSAVGIPPLSE